MTLTLLLDGVGADSTVTTATLSLYASGNYSDTDFIDEVRIRDWGGTLTTDDWVSGVAADTPSIDELTLVASHDTASGWADGYHAFTSEAAFLANIAKAGTTYIIRASDRFRTGTISAGNEFTQAYMADDATGGGGTDRDPKLYVEWTEGGAASDRSCLIQFGHC